jgi:LysR family transcriptional regulator, cys regulon transcriptional activator
MKLQQLRYIREVFQNDLNVSATAEKLFTSQPGISKQIRLLEEELGIDIFVRGGKQFVGVTPGGEQVLRLSGEILSKVNDIRKIAEEFHNREFGELSIATTHSQARYALPKVVQQFMQKYPSIRLTIHQGTPAQIAEQVSKGQVDIAIATEGTDLFENLTKLPCYQWNRSVIVPHGHPLTQVDSLTLEDIARYPIVTYTFGFTGRSQLDQAFEAAGIRPQVALTAVDADVIKTYVRLGLGVGIVAHMAHDPQTDGDLIPLEAAHLFAPSTTKIVIRRETYLRTFLYDFIEIVAPHLTRDIVDQAQLVREKHQWDELFGDIILPVH